MSNTKQQQQKRRAILDAAITPPTHKHMAVKMPIELHAKLKAEAEEKGMKLGRYACDLILKGKEGA